MAQSIAKPKTFELYKIDKSCVCIRTHKETKTAIAREVKMGKNLYQEFWSKIEPRRKLFSVSIGRMTTDGMVTLWNYGIAKELDLNDDGKPDYVWYGGDDTSSENWLYLSNGTEYKSVDLVKTIQVAWKARFNRKPPDLYLFGDKYGIGKMVIEKNDDGLFLIADVVKVDDADKVLSRTHFRIPENAFVDK